MLNVVGMVGSKGSGEEPDGVRGGEGLLLCVLWLVFG